MTKLQAITTLSESFELKTRDNGDSYFCTKNDASNEIVELVRECHFDMLTNDTSYSLIVRVIETLKDSLEYDENTELYDVEIETDVYNADLLTWVSSNLQRAEFVDEAMTEYGSVTLFEALQTGQYLELDAIKTKVINYLEETTEDRE
jgi:hypothetical protein